MYHTPKTVLVSKNLYSPQTLSSNYWVLHCQTDLWTHTVGSNDIHMTTNIGNIHTDRHHTQTHTHTRNAIT